MVHGITIVIQNVTTLKTENCPGLEGGKVPCIEVVNIESQTNF